MWKPVAILIALLAFVSFVALGAAAQTEAEDQRICHVGSDPDTTIYTCSRVISRGALHKSALTFPYRNRAKAYAQKGDYDRAIADWSELIRIEPRLVETYINRGSAYLQKGEIDRAIMDLSEAIRIEPYSVNAYASRAEAHIRKNNLQAALADIEAALRLVPSNTRLISQRSALRTKLGAGESKVASASHSPVPVVAAPSASVAAPAPSLTPAPAAVPAPAANPSAIAPLGPRVALVIGNGKYRTVPELANPANDARDVAAALRALGFKVIEGYDLDGTGMRAKIGEFGSAMTGAATTLFFYAGHGIQVAGNNYLIPTDARLERPSALTTEAISVETILADMETEKRINLVFLDACRDNPMSRSLAQAFGAGRSASVGQGLAQLNAGIGTLITFATSPNKVALDGTGRNSPFTTALLKHIHTPDLEVRTLLTRVRADVIRETNERQVPWDHSSLTGEFFFKRGR
jgi:tetratricopeptide (TPR) repeat protein